MYSLKGLVAVGALILAAVLLMILMRSATVSPGSMSVNELVQKSAINDGKLVSGSGVAKQGAGLFGLGGYRVRDASTSQEVFVISETGIPHMGSVATATGTYKQLIMIGGIEYGVIVPDAWCDETQAHNGIAQVVLLLCRRR